MTDTTETDSGTEEVDARDAPEPSRGAGAGAGYNALKDYDPEREFKFIETARGRIDETLLEHTRPFAEGVLLLIRLSAFAVVWSAAVIPFSESVSWFGYTPPPLWHALTILSVPCVVLIFVLVWLFVRVPIKLKWVAVYLEMYLDDEISNLLFRERDASKGELKGIHMGSNVALLKLLRLRMKAFHFWHRISIHTFILNGAFFRRVLETPFRSPRLWANGAPVMALAVFLSVQWGVLEGRGGVSGAPDEIVRAYGAQIQAALMSLRLGGEGFPAAPFIAGGFVLAFLAYWLSRRSRHWITGRLEGFLNTESFLTPFTHDCSRDILAKHEKLIQILARILARGRNGHGDSASGELGALILEEGLDDSGIHDPV